MDIQNYKFTKKDSFKISDFKTNDRGNFDSREDAVSEFVSNLKEINVLQQKLYSERKESVIFVFQAMDAAGKDGVIRTVFSTLTPHGVKEYCFKAPSVEELSHDYLWRFWPALPAKGNISIFNRSYYEDVLIGKVHELYKNQSTPDRLKNTDVIEKRYKEINDFEKYLYNNGTRIIKIFLNVSKDEQAKRFISRIDTPRKNWKISEADIKERAYWDEYQDAFEKMVNNTSSKNSPWYVVPADRKWYARLIVSRIVLTTLREINPQFPMVKEDDFEKVQEYRKELIESLSEKQKDKFKEVTENNEEKITEEKENAFNDVITDDENVEINDDSVFVNTSDVVTASYVEEEKEKIKEKKEEEKQKKQKKDKKKSKKKKSKIDKDEEDKNEDMAEEVSNIVTEEKEPVQEKITGEICDE